MVSLSGKNGMPHQQPKVLKDMYAHLMAVLVAPSIAFGMIPASFFKLLKHPEDAMFVKLKNKPSWRWFLHPWPQMVYTVVCEAIYMATCVFGVYLLAVNTAAEESKNGGNGAGGRNSATGDTQGKVTDHFVFLFNDVVIMIGSLACIYTWMLHSTQRFATAWINFCMDDFLQSSPVMPSAMDAGVTGRTKLCFTAIVWSCCGLLAIGLQAFWGLAPALKKLSTSYKILYGFGLVYTDFAACWALVSSVISFQVLRKLSKAFHRRFRQTFLETLERSSKVNQGPSGDWQNSSKASTNSFVSHHGDLYESTLPTVASESNTTQPVDDMRLTSAVINQTLVQASKINASSFAIEEDLEHLRLIYCRFRKHWSEFAAVNTIQLAATYAFACCLITTSSYFAIGNTISGESADGSLAATSQFVSHWVSAFLGLGFLAMICETGQDVEDHGTSICLELSMPLNDISPKAWQQLQSLAFELNQHPVKATIFKTVTLNRKLFIAGVTTIATYLIVLLQFKIGTK